MPTFTTSFFVDLYRHMEWADSAVWAAVRALPVRGVGDDERLRVLLYHIHNVQQLFLAVWRGDTPLYREASEFASLQAVERWARGYYSDAVAHLTSTTDDAWGTALTLPWAAMLTPHLGRVPSSTTLGETVFQVANHSTYHRGQVNARLRELGGQPPLVDYIAWVWFDRPSPVWP